ncbi:MAG: hypothetical protein Satyrvirus41_5 [Satyrvirus sp.]|uniref:Uncharacterized protein n=1 Tax=Satyrvirus sp. TaxID=2487771 RepID=A0A3G5AF29_9VIRU|nr:MAG: hypothetical protein Satyrvirus41_5 [Satyrvirus sp.]
MYLENILDDISHINKCQVHMSGRMNENIDDDSESLVWHFNEDGIQYVIIRLNDGEHVFFKYGTKQETIVLYHYDNIEYDDISVMNMTKTAKKNCLSEFLGWSEKDFAKKKVEDVLNKISIPKNYTKRFSLSYTGSRDIDVFLDSCELIEYTIQNKYCIHCGDGARHKIVIKMQNNSYCCINYMEACQSDSDDFDIYFCNIGETVRYFIE